jgi:hypothetical protein
MSKTKKVWIPIIIGVLAGGVGAGIFLWNKQAKMEAPTAVVASPTPTSMPIEMTTWTDQAGFTFGYPKDILVNPHEEDTVNYAHVELTHKDHPGKIIVWVKDLPAPDLAGWIKKEKRFTGASVFDTTLGGKPAKKILIADLTKMIVAGAIDNDVLVTVEGELADGDYWSKVHQGIVDSFTLAPAEPSGNSGGNATEEEVLE